VRWKLWYADGSTFTDGDGTWLDAPALGVLVLATEDPDVGRELDHGPRGEFYAWWPDASKPWGFDRTGLLDYLHAVGWPPTTLLGAVSLADLSAAGVKVGRSVDNDRWRGILSAAVNDPYLPPKSAGSGREAT
jgi:hypothetical protein